MKWVSHIKKNNWQYLLPMIKFNISKGTRMRLVIILMNMVFFIFIVKYVNIFKICITQWTDSFQMTNAYVTRFEVQDFNLIKYEKFVDMFSDFTLQLTFKKLLVKFGAISKKNIHNFLKRLIAYFFLSNYISVWVGFSVCTSAERIDHNGLRTEADIRTQLFLLFFLS